MAFLVLLWASRPALGEPNEIETLESSYAIEGQLFDSAFDRFRDAREEERSAIARLAKLTARADDILGAERLDTREMWKAELEIEKARGALVAASELAAVYRREVGFHLERLSQLGVTIDRLRDRTLVRTEALDGRWKIQVEPSSELGLMDLRLDGTLVTGAYRLSSGTQGSIRGTYTNHRLELERVDTLRGIDMTLTGEHDPVTGEIRGTWEAVVPRDIGGSAGLRDSVTGKVRRDSEARDAGPRDVFGEWSAKKISPTEEEEIFDD